MPPDPFILFDTDDGPVLLRRSSIERVVDDTMDYVNECTLIMRDGFSSNLRLQLVEHTIEDVLQKLNPPLDIPDTTYSVDVKQTKRQLDGPGPRWVGTIKAVTK